MNKWTPIIPRIAFYVLLTGMLLGLFILVVISILIASCR